MNKIKQSAIAGYDYNISQLQRLRDAVDLLPDELEELKAHIYSSSGGLRVDIPMTPTAFAQARPMLGEAWQRRPEREYQADDGGQYFYFTHKETEVELTLCLDPTRVGATCERVQFGTKEIPLYKTVCM